MRQHDLDVVQRVGLAQQIVANEQAYFTDHMGGRMQEQIERSRDHAFSRVFDAHDAVLRTACSSRVKDLVEARAVDEIGRAAEVFDSSLFAERALRPKYGN